MAMLNSTFFLNAASFSKIITYDSTVPSIRMGFILTNIIIIIIIIIKIIIIIIRPACSAPAFTKHRYSKSPDSCTLINPCGHQ